jgi:hypothetical protein
MILKCENFKVGTENQAQRDELCELWVKCDGMVYSQLYEKRHLFFYTQVDHLSYSEALQTEDGQYFDDHPNKELSPVEAIRMMKEALGEVEPAKPKRNKAKWSSSHECDGVVYSKGHIGKASIEEHNNMIAGAIESRDHFNAKIKWLKTQQRRYKRAEKRGF